MESRNNDGIAGPSPVLPFPRVQEGGRRDIWVHRGWLTTNWRCNMYLMGFILHGLAYGSWLSAPISSVA